MLASMEWLNYHHLYYFWTVAREGTVARAGQTLRLAQPTISGQIRALERSLGERLFAREGRRLALTETGRVVYRYADEIFLLGRELTDTLRGRPTGRPLRLVVGVADVVPKLITYHVLEPALAIAEPVRLIVREGKPDQLLAALALHELDLVLTDAPMPASVKVKGFNHLLGECGVEVFASARLAKKLRPRFPKSLEGAPFLLPTDNTTLRRTLDQWFDAKGIRPRTVGEFEDFALLKLFGQAGVGAFAAHAAIAREVRRQYGVVPVGRIDGLREHFYAISVERRLKHPAVVAILEAARRDLFE